jgi:carboxymethylenebutenolidase
MTRTIKLLVALVLLPLATMSLQAQDWAKTRLEASPRHHEYVALKHGDRTVQAFVVYPEVKDKAPVVVLIHEIFGLSDWAKEMADELAAQGFIVVAPDLLTGFGPNGGGSDSFPSQDATTKAVSGLDPAIVTADLDAAADYGKKIPAANGRIAVVGFCWGGGKSFAFATHRKDLSAAFVFYGPGPSDVSTINAPVYGFYAGNDARIGATVPGTIAAMKAAGKKYDTVAGNKTAREEGFKRLVTLLREMKSSSVASRKTTSGKGLAKESTAAVSCHGMSATNEMAAIM